ncbi:hypothetical protein [Actinomadura gamaensis]|uniref:CHRD domain-containing protein n=1 Tax=Actinomadura gamaensis TaxID=1763541 RepID=A0ABV9TY90_9ACTN
MSTIRVHAARATVAALTLSAALAIAPGTPAHADDTPLVSCDTGYIQQTISPGLTALPTFNTVTVTGTFGPCVNQVLDPDHTYGVYTATASGVISCTINAPITNATGTVDWQDASHHHTGSSHFSGGITLSQRPVGETVGIVVATIDSGHDNDFAGHPINVTSARLNFDPTQCLESGIKSVAGPGTLQVLP